MPLHMAAQIKMSPATRLSNSLALCPGQSLKLQKGQHVVQPAWGKPAYWHTPRTRWVDNWVFYSSSLAGLGGLSFMTHGDVYRFWYKNNLIIPNIKYLSNPLQKMSFNTLSCIQSFLFLFTFDNFYIYWYLLVFLGLFSWICYLTEILKMQTYITKP